MGEDLIRKIVAVIMAEASREQEEDVMWIYLNRVIKENGEEGLKGSTAYVKKGRDYRIFLYALGDHTYGSTEANKKTDSS